MDCTGAYMSGTAARTQFMIGNHIPRTVGIKFRLGIAFCDLHGTNGLESLQSPAISGETRIWFIAIEAEKTEKLSWTRLQLDLTRSHFDRN